MRRLLLTCLAAAAVFIAGSAFAMPQSEFLRQAIETDNSEIQAGQLAAQKGSTPAVRDFGNLLVQDHTQHRAQTAAVAKTLGVSVPDTVLPAAKAEKPELESLSGPAFDQSSPGSWSRGTRRPSVISSGKPTSMPAMYPR